MSSQPSSRISPNVLHVRDPVQWRGKPARVVGFETQPDRVIIQLEGWVTTHKVSHSEVE